MARRRVFSGDSACGPDMSSPLVVHAGVNKVVFLVVGGIERLSEGLVVAWREEVRLMKGGCGGGVWRRLSAGREQSEAGRVGQKVSPT